jgi:hypothetical protein
MIVETAQEKKQIPRREGTRFARSGSQRKNKMTVKENADRSTR